MYFDEQETSIITICNIFNNISKFLTYDTTVNKNVYLGGERGVNTYSEHIDLLLTCLLVKHDSNDLNLKVNLTQQSSQNISECNLENVTWPFLDCLE